MEFLTNFGIMRFLIIPIFVIGSLLGYAQSSIDSAFTVPMISASYMVQVPGGDMADRFGVNSNIGGSFLLKLKSGFLLDLNGNFLFSGNLKGDAASLFDSIKTSNDALIGSNGEYAKFRTFERGFFAGARIGYVFPVFRRNPNSGPFFTVGAGILQHKIRIEVESNNLPQIMGDYKQGYDKLTNGPALTQFIGYLYLSHDHLTNFYAGFEFYQAFTQSRRSWDYKMMQRDTRKRIDLLYSFKFGWVIPIYRRVPDKYYYN